MAGIFSIAVRLGATMIVFWAPSTECGARYFDLFDGGPASMVIVDIQPTTHGDLHRYIADAALAQKRTFSSVHLTNFEVDSPRLIALLADVTLLWTRGTHAVADISCRDYLFVKSTFYRSLEPAKEVR